MKAIIMAGGKGVRLQPISYGCPKPMIPILDRPVLEHTIDLLKRNGITEARATLQYMPEQIIRHFEENPPTDFSLSYSIEQEPLGTAGSVAACREFYGDEDFLVLSGDAVCSIDLRACIEQHRAWGADATLLLYRHPRPLEYGLVMTSRDGRIERFIEKPNWGQVFCDTVNTGIYIVNPRLMESVEPGRPVDFAKDLFRDALRQNGKLYGLVVEGYWCDVGSPEAYMECHRDILSGRAGIPLKKHAVDLPADVEILEPVYIAEAVRIGQGAKIGPYSVLGRGTSIGAGASVEYSVCYGAKLGSHAEVRGGILCKGTKVGRDAQIGEGCVLGENCEVGPSASIVPGTKVWPGIQVEGGTVVPRNVRSSSGPLDAIPLDDHGDITGSFDLITPEYGLRLGAAFGEAGKISIGYVGTRAAETLCAALICGIRAVGGKAIRHDARFAAEAAFAGRYFGSKHTLFVEETAEQIKIRVLPANRALPARELLRKMVQAWKTEIPAQRYAQYGEEAFALGVPMAYEQSLRQKVPGNPGEVRIKPVNEPSKLLSRLIFGGAPSPRGTKQSPSIWVSSDGNTLFLEEEDGRKLDAEKIRALLVLIHFLEGNRVLTVPFDSPKIYEQIAEQCFGELRRQSTGEFAEGEIAQSEFLRDGMEGAIKLCKFLSQSGMGLAELKDRLPKFAVYRTQTLFQGDRGLLMRNLSARSPDRELGDGIRLPVKGGWVHVAPALSRPYIRVMAESFNAEMARELSAELVKEISALRDVPPSAY